MKFTILLATLLAGAVAANPAPTPPVASRDPTFCNRGVKLCEIAQSFEDCSDVYLAAMKAYVPCMVRPSLSGLADKRPVCRCMLTGCIEWIIDPIQHCEKEYQTS